MDEVEKFYKVRAEEFVDMLFDKNYFREDVDRRDMQGVEDLLAWMFENQVKSAIKCHNLIKRLKERQLTSSRQDGQGE